MELSEKIILSLSLLWAALILALGAWWLYLLVQFERSASFPVGDLPALIKWEGGAFLLALILISVALFYLYLKNQRKGRSLQTFFSAMTHELKTPLASVRLQAEVLQGELDGEPRLKQLAGRLIEGTQTLETRMDKILQLSRMQRGGNLTIKALAPVAFLQKCRDKWGGDLSLDIRADNPPDILADEFALELIFRNLFENTRTHTNEKRATIALCKEGKHLSVRYCDGGKFQGDVQKIGTLFYKHDSKGSGIGLHLIKLLMRRLGGDFAISVADELIFTMNFPINFREAT